MIQDGNPANAAYTNTKLMSRTNDTSTVGKVSLENTLPESGATVSNAQRAVNETFDAVGMTGIGDTTRKNYSSNNYITNGDSHKVAIGKLDTQLDLTQAQLDALDLINSQDITIGAIGTTPNANAMTLTGQLLNVEPASASFGGVVTTGSQTFAGTKTFQNNVIVTGDLTVNGLTTTVNSTIVEVADPTMLLNNGGNDASSEGAGIHVERTTTNASIVFENALASKWKAGLLGSESELLNAGSAQVVTGNKDFQGDIKTDIIAESTLAAGVTIDGVLIKDNLVDGRDVSVDGTAQDNHIAATSIHFAEASISHANITNIGTNTHAQIDTHVASTSNPHSVTKTQVSLGNVTDDAQLKRAAADFNSFTEKTTPVSADIVLIEDSADSYNKKKVQLTNLGLGGSGSGTGSKNYLPSTTYEGSAVTGWVAYKNTTPGLKPEVTPGGTPSGNLSFTASATSPLSGTSSLLYAKGAFNTQGEGYYYDMTIDPSDKGKINAFLKNYGISSGTYADDQAIIYFVDKTNDIVLEPTPFNIKNHTLTSERFFSELQIPYNCTTLRICIHVAGTSASAYTIKMDDLLFGPQAKQYGAVATDWVSYTPTGSWTTSTTYSGKWRKVGDSMEIKSTVSLDGAPNAALFTLNIPSGYSIDTAKINGYGPGSSPLGSASILRSGVQVFPGTVYYNSTTSVTITYGAANGAGVNTNNGVVNATNPATFAANDFVGLEFSIPILGWSSSQLLSSEASTRVIAARAYQNVNQSLPDSVTTKITLNGISGDSVGGFDLPNSQYIFKVPGWYEVVGSVTFSPNNTNNRNGYIYKNGAIVQTTSIMTSAVNNVTAVMIYKGEFKSGDTVDLRAYQSSGGALNTAGVDSLTNLSVNQIQGPSQIAASETVFVEANSTAGQAISTSSPIFIAGTILSNSHGAYNAATGELAVPKAGVLEVEAHISTASHAETAGNLLSLELYKNGSYVRSFNQHRLEASSTNRFGIGGSTSTGVITGDVITVRVYSTASTNLGTSAGGNWLTFKIK